MTNMKIDDKTSHNSPSLRFPEFTGEWERCVLGDVLEFSNTRINSSELNSGNYVSTENILQNFQGIVKARSIPEDTNVMAFSCGNILLSNIRPYLKKVWKATFNGGCSSDVFVLQANSNIDADYLHYVVANDKFIGFVMNGAKGVKMPRGDKNQMKTYSLSLPSIKEQRKISRFLSFLDERIAVQNRLIEKYESLIKALRHHLFSTLESVKEVPVADLLSYEQPTKYIVSDTEYSNNTDLTPVLTANKAFILGYTDEVEGIYDKGPCIILDDFTLDFKIVEFPFKVKSSAIKILSAKTTVSLRYIFEYLKFLDLNTEEHKRHYIAEIEPMSIELPEEDTIKSIAFLFDLMDKRRKGLERDQQLLKSQKDYLLREIFI